MTIQKHLIAAVASTVFIFLLDYVWYMMLMGDYFDKTGQRAEPDFLWLILGLFSFSVAFVYIYSKGAESDSKVNQGMKFGIWATLITWLPMNFVWYAVIDAGSMSEMMVDTVYRLVQMILLGIIVAHLTGIPGGGGDREGGKGGTG